MITLERLRADHADALLAFELENREYFARAVSDRGDAFFEEFAAGLQDRLDEQESGECRYHVIVDETGALIGRINLFDVEDGAAVLGYRVGEKAAGRGVATAAVAQLQRLAAADYGVFTLTALTSVENKASQTVLERNAFRLVGDAQINGHPAVRYEWSSTSPARAA